MRLAVGIYVEGDVAVEHEIEGLPLCRRRPRKREQHVAPLDLRETVVLEIIDAPQVVRCQVALDGDRRGRHVAAAELVGPHAIADQGDVPDRADPLQATEGLGG